MTTKLRFLEGAPLTCVFDTNGVRDLARVDDAVWSKFAHAWRASRLKTAWPPHVLGEILSTNLTVGCAPAPMSIVADVQTAAQRFSALAVGPVYLGTDELMRASIYKLAGEPLIPVVRHELDWEFGLELLYGIENGEQIQVIDVENNVPRVRILDKSLKRGMTIERTRDFADHANRRVAHMSDRLERSGPVSPDQRAADLMADLPKVLLHTARDLDIPIDVVRRAAAADKAMLLSSALVIRALCENVYYHMRATAEKSRVRENDATDIALTTYLEDASFLVTSDRDLTRLVPKQA